MQCYNYHDDFLFFFFAARKTIVHTVNAVRQARAPPTQKVCGSQAMEMRDGVKRDASEQLKDMMLRSVSWAMYVSLFVGLVLTWHHFDLAYKRHSEHISNKRAVVEGFCNNHTMMQLTAEYAYCRRTREAAARDPFYEALVETLLSWHICSSGVDPHKMSHEDSDVDEGHVLHCEHGYYVALGVVLALIAVNCCACRRRAPRR